MTETPDPKEVRCLSAVDPAEWDALVAASDDTWLWHTHAWIAGTGRVLNVETRYVIVSDGGRPVAGMPMQLRSEHWFGRSRRRAHGIAMGSSGPFAARDLPDRRRSRALARVTDAAVAWARDEGAEELLCSLPPLAPAHLANSRGVNPLVPAGWDDASTHTRIVDLAVDEARLLGGLAYDARRSIRLAGEAGYTVAAEPWRDRLDEYYRVHVETYRRTGAAPYPKEYFGLIAALSERGQAVLWVARDGSGRPVAFHNDGRCREGSLYWSGCCETEHLRSGVNYLLTWEAMRGARRDGCRWYDIGEVFPNVREGKLHGLTTFKEKFGGDLYRYYRGQLHLRAPAGPSFSWRARELAAKVVWRLFPTLRRSAT
jgi:hypothetical protein